MSDDDYREIFVRKLHHYMTVRDKTQTDLMRDLGLSSSTVSNWCTGLKLPRMNKIQMLADYFGIKKSDLLEDKPEERQFYVSAKEQNMIEQYRALDDSGREMVDMTIEMQYKRVTQDKKGTGQLFA